MTIFDEYADRMFDLLAVAPDGLVRDDIMAQLGIQDVNTFHRIKGRLQDKLGTIDINVVGDSDTAMAGGWTYSLQGDPSNVTARSYLIKKLRNLFGRQRRAYLVTVSLVRGTPGNTAQGRSSRRLARSQYRAMEDTSDVLAELGRKPPELPPAV